MKQRIFKKIKDISYEELSESLLWPQLSNNQKQRVILNNMRMLDAEVFLHEFESFEQPGINNSKIEK